MYESINTSPTRIGRSKAVRGFAAANAAISALVAAQLEVDVK